MTQHVLACFGGAGGQHACAIAAALGIRTIFVHRYSGILSAVGIGLAEVVQEAQVGLWQRRARFQLPCDALACMHGCGAVCAVACMFSSPPRAILHAALLGEKLRTGSLLLAPP